MGDSPGLATISRSKFLNMVYGDSLKDLLNQNKLTSRNLFEISSATTQCNNVIGQCSNTSCTCWICGCPIFLDLNGKPYDQPFINRYVASGKNGSRVRFIRDNKMSSDILPQCEHILPVMQAFLILGELYWNETYEKTSDQIKERLKMEYAWSHAYCNNIKDDTNLFDDVGGIRKDHISSLLNRVYAKVKPIRLFLEKQYGKSSKAPTQWIKSQQANMIKTYLSPLVRIYKEQTMGKEQGLHLLASVISPVHHIEVSLRKNLSSNHKVMDVLEKYRPEKIIRLQIPQWAQVYRRLASDKKVPTIFSSEIRKGLKMFFLREMITKLYTEATLIGKTNEITNHNTIENLIKNFINKIINLQVCIADLRHENERNIVNIAIPNCVDNYILQIIDEPTLYAIIVLANKYLSYYQEFFILTIVQTIVVFKMLFLIKTDKDIGLILKELKTNYSTTNPTSGFIDELHDYLKLSIDVLVNKISESNPYAVKMNSEQKTLYINLIQFILNFTIDPSKRTSTKRTQTFTRYLSSVLDIKEGDRLSESLTLLRETPLYDEAVIQFETTLGKLADAMEKKIIVPESESILIERNPETGQPTMTNTEMNESIEMIEEETQEGKEEIVPLTTEEEVRLSSDASKFEEKLAGAKILLAFKDAQLLNKIHTESGASSPTPPDGGKRTRKRRKLKKTNKTKRRKSKKSKKSKKFRKK